MSKELEEMKKRYKAGLLNRNLKGEFLDYLTEIDCTSPCERLPDAYQNHLDRKYTKKTDGRLDIEGFRAWCEAIDADKAWIEKTERELF